METLRDVMSTLLVTVPAHATVAEAAQVMSIEHVGAALIVEGDTLHGIFTERDIVRALAAEHDAAGHAVAGWMTADPITLGPDAKITEARDRMLEEGFRHIPIVEDERLIGIVSLRDLAGRENPAGLLASIASKVSRRAAWTWRKMSASCSGLTLPAAPRAAIAVISHALSNTCQSVSRDIGDEPPHRWVG
jgi:CBS domain-containing protein